MTDLFLLPDDRVLLAKWDYLASVFRIVAREYRRVLDGSVSADRHRTILIQTVSELIDVEADLYRLGTADPAAGFKGWMKVGWEVASAWVRELRAWRLPPASVSVADIEAALERRQRLEVAFVAAVCAATEDADDEPADDPPAVLVSRAG